MRDMWLQVIARTLFCEEAFAALVRFRVWNSEARFEALALVDSATGSVAEHLE